MKQADLDQDSKRQSTDIRIFETDGFVKFSEGVHAGSKVLSAYVLDRHGVVPAVSKMAFGNSMGVKLSDEIPAGQLFAPAFTDIVAEVEADKIDEQFLNMLRSVKCNQGVDFIYSIP